MDIKEEIKLLKKVVKGMRKNNCLEENCISCNPNCFDGLDDVIIGLEFKQNKSRHGSE